MAFVIDIFSDAINESEINLYPFDGMRPLLLYGSGSGALVSSGEVTAALGREITGSGTVYGSGIASADITTFIRVQVMHTDRTLYIYEDDRDLNVNDEEIELEIYTEYTELDVPPVATFYS